VVQCRFGDVDAYLCATLMIPTGNGSFYELPNCSRNSIRANCFPGFAEPVDRRPTRPQRDSLPPRDGRRRH
jgi:hypothetical protein